MAQTLARWQHPVVSSKALDVLHRPLHPASHRRIPMVIKIASYFPAFFCIINFVVAIKVANDYVTVIVIKNELHTNLYSSY
jgi:hypothetical protein